MTQQKSTWISREKLKKKISELVKEYNLQTTKEDKLRVWNQIKPLEALEMEMRHWK